MTRMCDFNAVNKIEARAEDRTWLALFPFILILQFVLVSMAMSHHKWIMLMLCESNKFSLYNWNNYKLFI